MRIITTFCLEYFLAIVFIAILHRVGSLDSIPAICELSFFDNQKLYNFSLASPLPKFPHGVLSEDGYLSFRFSLFLDLGCFSFALNFPFLASI